MRNKKSRRTRKRQRPASVQASTVALFLWIVLCATPTSAKLQGRAIWSAVDLLLCRVTVEDTIYRTKAEDMYSREQTVCIPIVDDVEDTGTYSVELPNHITETFQSEIRMGRLRVFITGASIRGDVVVTTPKTTFSVDEDGTGRGQRHLLDEPNYRHAFGRKRYAIVRISTIDSEPLYSLEHMVNRFTDETEGMEAQYRVCSKHQVQFEMTGAYDIQLPSSMDSYEMSPRVIREAAMERLVAEHNIGRFPEDIADHILWCIPPGTGTWGALFTVLRSAKKMSIRFSPLLLRIQSRSRKRGHRSLEVAVQRSLVCEFVCCHA